LKSILTLLTIILIGLLHINNPKAKEEKCFINNQIIKKSSTECFVCEDFILKKINCRELETPCKPHIRDRDPEEDLQVAMR